MKRKKGQGIKPAIPLVRLLAGGGARRNYDILEREANRDEKLVSALKDELFSNAATSIEHKDAQKRKAKQPRIKGRDGRTMNEVIETVAKQHPNESPKEIWPHFGSAIHEWADDCRLKSINGDDFYEYEVPTGKVRTIKYKHFCEALRAARRSEKPD